jgi:hypothetical protein
MRFDADHIRQQIANLLAAHPELIEDDVLRADMIEGATDAHEFLRSVERRRREAAAFAGAIEGEIADLEARQHRYERREKAMRTLMFKVLEAAEQRKCELPEATLSIAAGRPKVFFTDENAIPDGYCQMKREPRKSLIGIALAEGKTVPGAVISNSEPTLTVRVK